MIIDGDIWGSCFFMNNIMIPVIIHDTVIDYWLVLWNSYFSEGLKPPTRLNRLGTIGDHDNSMNHDSLTGISMTTPFGVWT